MNKNAPQIGLIMGSRSDWETMQHCAELMSELGLEFEQEVVSAHRTPDKMFCYAEQAAKRGIQVIIAAAGGAAAPGTMPPKRAAAMRSFSNCSGVFSTTGAGAGA